jgi:hypothetical protein
VSKKSSRRKPIRKGISPLLGALVREATPTAQHPALLQAFVALDAFRNGRGGGGLFVELAQLYVVSEKLCERGYYQERLAVCKTAQEAICAMESRYPAGNEDWTASPQEYAQMRAGVELLDEQLMVASKDDYRMAEKLMAIYVLTSRGGPEGETTESSTERNDA